jgi:hypothetical protein
VPIPVTVPSNAWACGLSHAGIGVSIPAWDIDACLVCVELCQSSLHLTEHSSRGDLPSEVCVLDCDG